MHPFHLLTAFLSLTVAAHACHHPAPSHPVSCSLSFNRAKASTNGTHLIIQGTTTQSTRCKSKRADLPESIDGSVIHVFTKDTTHLKDGQGHDHTGNDCQINVPLYTLPTLEKAETTKVIVPLQDDIQIHCERRRFKSKQQPTKKAASPTTTTITTTTTTTTTTKTHRKPTTTTHKSKPTTTKKEPKPTHHSNHDDEDEDDKDDNQSWDYDHGQVTFFTPNQGACGEWNDDNDFIVALGEDLYGDMDEESKLCGKKILIQGPKGNEITVTVADACPPCKADHLDLSPAAFAKLGKFDTGVLKVKWRFL